MRVSVVELEVPAGVARLVGDGVLEVGGPGALVRLVAGDSVELLGWIDGARAEVLECRPDLVAAPPAPVVEARAVLLEDVLGRLGVPVAGAVREIDEISQADVRTARRMAAHAVGLLDEVLVGSSERSARCA